MEEFPKTLSDFSVSYRDESLFMEDVSLERIVDAVGTPATALAQRNPPSWRARRRRSPILQPS